MQCLLDRCTLSEFDIEPSFRIAVWYAGDDDYVTLNGVSSQYLRLVRFQRRLSTWPKLSRDVVTEDALRVYALDRWQRIRERRSMVHLCDNLQVFCYLYCSYIFHWYSKGICAIWFVVDCDVKFGITNQNVDLK